MSAPGEGFGTESLNSLTVSIRNHYLNGKDSDGAVKNSEPKAVDMICSSYTRQMDLFYEINKKVKSTS